MVLTRSSSFSDKVLGAGVLETGKVFKLLATGECSKDIGNGCPRAVSEEFEVAESIQFGVPLGDFLAPFE